MDRKPDLALVVADPRRIADLQADDVPALLAALEQLRVSLWARMLRVPAPAAREVAIDVGDQILTVPEVAAELKFTRGYVYEAIRRRDLTAVRKGKYVRVLRSDLRAWLDGHALRGLDVQPTSPDSARHAPARSGPPSHSKPIAPASRRGRTNVGATAQPLNPPDS